MTAQTLDNPTVQSAAIPVKKPAAERARFPLVLKLFGLTALLILLVVGVAIGITIQRANTIATETVNSSIQGAGKLFEELQSQRLSALSLPTRLLGTETAFVAYVQSNVYGSSEEPAQPVDPAAQPVAADPAAPPAPPTVDMVSLVDQLQQRKTAFKADLLMLLNEEGRLIARSDQPAVAPSYEDLYEATPLVKTIVEDANLRSTEGVLQYGGKLYHAAVAPVGGGARDVRIAYLLTAVNIDEKFANSIADSTKAGVMFASSSGLVRSRNAPSFGMQQMNGVDRIVKSGKPMAAATQQIDGNSYVLTGQPLLAGTQPVGAAVFLRSRDTELKPFREIEQSLLAGGGVALLLAFILSWIIAKRLTRPIEELAGMAQAVTAGDYSVQPDIHRSDEVGILGRSFAKMINSLRDKAELEELYNSMAARAEEREAIPARTNEAATLDYGTVLVTDLRGLPATVGEGDATNVISVIAAAMRVQEKEVERQDGEVREIVGHRLVSVFRGDRGIIHAIRASRAMNEELASLQPPMTVGVGISTGEFVTGSVNLNNESGLAIVGDAPLLAMLFAWHAPTGYAYISYETAQAAGAEVLGAVQREEVKLRWLAQPLPVASLPLVSVNTSMMRAIGSSTSTMATMRLDGSSLPVSNVPADLVTGHLFAGRYRIEQILGRGGMGVVYKASDTQLDEVVAIKTLPGDVMQRSPEDLERFKREIRLARRITHRNVLRTYDYGEAEGVYFISMEFVRGYTLSELLDEAPNRQMAPRVAVGIARQICRGLQAAHEQGIIHRDIKPQNVLIDAKGEVKLMDFGIARMTETNEAMTQAGLIVGTPHYMSPEQVQGKALDPRSDVYSMGILMYEMLVGRRTFESSSLTGVLTAHITEKPVPPIDIRPDIGRELNAIVLRCLTKETKERYADAGALLTDLDRVQIRAAAAA
ncbi:MAG TPA: protein kinase [Thermoanaerobaculia bacterium]